MKRVLLFLVMALALSSLSGCMAFGGGGDYSAYRVGTDSARILLEDDLKGVERQITALFEREGRITEKDQNIGRIHADIRGAEAIASFEMSESGLVRVVIRARRWTTNRPESDLALKLCDLLEDTYGEDGR